jgi:hypothetical protein
LVLESTLSRLLVLFSIFISTHIPFSEGEKQSDGAEPFAYQVSDQCGLFLFLSSFFKTSLFIIVIHPGCWFFL